MEQHLLGISLTCSKLDKFNQDIADTTVKEFLRGKKSSLMTFAIEIREIREYTTKNDDVMAFLKVADQTAQMDLVAFASVYEQMQEEDLAYPGAKLLVAAKPSEKNDQSLIIERVKELKVNA
jgi:DNA polymerase III alpha subunit